MGPCVQVIWEEFLKLMKEEAGSQVVETWFKAVTLHAWDPATSSVTLKCPNQFISQWIQDHYHLLLKTHLSRLFHTPIVSLAFENHSVAQGSKRNIIPASMANQTTTLEITHEESASSQDQGPLTVTQPYKNHLPVKQQRSGKTLSDQLQSHYVFDNFVVGSSNSLAYAAAHAVSDSLGQIYNPLFIYGGTGLGKTHLLHAIGNEVKRNYPQAVIRYETSDQFINEFITSIRHDRIQQFRAKYQSIDVLLLDDIQFLSNKEQTQEAFFHIFNTMHEQHKQIVLSSDTFPKEIKGLQSRLKSRMEWGLVADIQMPDLETKITILNRKAAQHAIELPLNVAHFIASRIISNVRELEGGLIRISAFATLVKQPITIEMAKKVLISTTEKRHEDVQLETVIKTVAKHFSIAVHDIKSKKRHYEIALARQVAFYLMKKLTLCSLQIIGKFMGGRDHSTVIHALTKVEKMIKSDHHFSQKTKMIEQDIAMQ